MREKWLKKEIQQEKQRETGQPIGQRISLYPEAYRPKLLASSSIRAIDQYNSIVTDDFSYSYDNISYAPENEGVDSKSIYSTYTNSYYNGPGLGNNTHTLDKYSSRGTIYTTNENLYDYATVRSNSTIAGTSTVASDADTERRDALGSAATLISGSKATTCWSWLAYVETVFCTISLAAGLGNVYRLTQLTLIQGGLPFFVAYVILLLFIGFPILFLELGLGQLVQEGFTKTWRAVPLLKGVTYVKFLALCLISLYYPLYVALFAFYLIWYAQGAPPFPQCNGTIIEEGYFLVSPGQECIRKTFLESPFTDPGWYGIYVSLLLLIWVVASILLCRRTRAFAFSLILLILLSIGCFIALTVKAVDEDGKYFGIDKLLTNIDWSLLATGNVWYFAAVQVFFSTNIGMGPFVTNAGIIYKKANVFWVALSLIFLSLIFGISSIVLTYTLSGNLYLELESGDIPEVHLLAVIYNSALQYSNGPSQIWALTAISLLLCSGFISIITIVYTILKAVRVESRHGWSWWQTLVLTSFTGIVLGSAALLMEDFKIVRLLDHYIVGNLILLCTILEISAIVSYYGSKRLRLDFEFLLGTKLPILCIILWWFVPLALLAIFIWALATINLIGTIDDDPLWLYTTGWSVVVASVIFIALVAIYQITKQDEYYTFGNKIKASTKPLRKWGPIDPIMRYNWVQWHSKAKKGVRDFTLKRRGTRDYTHSIKKNKSFEARNLTPLSEISTVREGSTAYHNNDLNQNNIRLSNTSSQYIEPLSIHEYNIVETKKEKETDLNDYDEHMRVTYCFDALDPPARAMLYNVYEPKNEVENKNFHNPLSNPDVPNVYNEDTNGSSPSEGYGTFQKRPYIIDDNITCFRKNSEFEESTEL